MRRRPGWAGSSRMLSVLVRMRIHGSVVVVVLLVVVTVEPAQPVGSLVSSTPSGRTPKSGIGQPTSRAPRSGAAPVKPSFRFGRIAPPSTAFEAPSRVVSAGAIVVRKLVGGTSPLAKIGGGRGAARAPPPPFTRTWRGA